MSATRVATDEVIGIDAGLISERRAEHALAAVAAALEQHGVHGVWLATHRAATRDGVHVALSLALSGASIRTGEIVDVVRRSLDDLDAAVADHVEAAGPSDRVGAAAFARASLLGRSEGRVVRFPGSGTLVGTIGLTAVLADTAIDRVHALAGGNVTTDDVLRTRDFVRPRFERGELVLHVQRAAGGILVPFETPNPTPCCADH